MGSRATLRASPEVARARKKGGRSLEEGEPRARGRASTSRISPLKSDSLGDMMEKEGPSSASGRLDEKTVAYDRPEGQATFHSERSPQ